MSNAEAPSWRARIEAMGFDDDKSTRLAAPRGDFP
jgi:hypothetical protein